MTAAQAAPYPGWQDTTDPTSPPSAEIRAMLGHTGTLDRAFEQVYRGSDTPLLMMHARKTGSAEVSTRPIVAIPSCGILQIVAARAEQEKATFPIYGGVSVCSLDPPPAAHRDPDGPGPTRVIVGIVHSGATFMLCRHAGADPRTFTGHHYLCPRSALRDIELPSRHDLPGELVPLRDVHARIHDRFGCCTQHTPPACTACTADQDRQALYQ
jgi:hypothetical protein